MFRHESEHRSCLIKIDITTIRHSRHWRTSSVTAKQTEETVYIIKNASACRVETGYCHTQRTTKLFFFFLKHHGVKHLYGNIRGTKKNKKLADCGFSHIRINNVENKPVHYKHFYYIWRHPNHVKPIFAWLLIGWKTWALLSQSTNTTNTVRQQVYLQGCGSTEQNIWNWKDPISVTD